eukprot:jgi/Undpi1/1121/HiC_scaffold_10.g04583.m1
MPCGHHSETSVFEKTWSTAAATGKWQMLYSTVPGPSSGRLGPFVGSVFQDIRPAEGRIVNILELGPSWGVKGALEADVEVLDGNNWAIVFDVVRKTFAGIQFEEKIFDREDTERRIWNMTYLDEGFRVLYGRQESMSPEEGFIFVMERRLLQAVVNFSQLAESNARTRRGASTQRATPRALIAAIVCRIWQDRTRIGPSVRQQPPRFSNTTATEAWHDFRFRAEERKLLCPKPLRSLRILRRVVLRNNRSTFHGETALRLPFRRMRKALLCL